MSDDSSLEIGFTEVLYGVVVASAITQLQFELTIRNVMLLLTLAFILGDWIEYQIGVQEATETTVNYVAAFVLDVVILIVWYLMTILPVADLDWFFVTAGIFFFLQAVWDTLILGYGPSELIKKPHINLSMFFIILAGIRQFSDMSSWLLLVIATVIFIAGKSPRWHTLITKSPDAL